MEAQSTDKAAWVEAALAQYERRLVVYATAITGNEESARDVVQDVFLHLCQADPAKLGDSSGPWLYRVCRNRALDVRRKEGRMATMRGAWAATATEACPGPRQAATRHETQAMVAARIDTLPEPQREVLHLKFDHGLTYREISEVTGSSLGTVSNLMTAAFMSLREQLKPHMDLAGEA